MGRTHWESIVRSMVQANWVGDVRNLAVGVIVTVDRKGAPALS